MILAAAFGVAIGLSLGLLGGGGSILTVPVLVFVLGQPVEDAVPTSLLVVGSAAVAGALSHMRMGRVRWRAVVPFGLSGVPGSFAGAAVNHRMDPDAVLIGFASLMAVVAVAMLRRAHRLEAGDAVAKIDRPDASMTGRALAAGFGVGVLTGLFGTGGGFLIVAAFVVLLGFEMQAAVASALVIVAVNSAAGFVAHLGYGTLDFGIAMVFSTGGLAGAVIGERLSTRIRSERLERWFAYSILGLAAFIVLQVATGSPPH